MSAYEHLLSPTVQTLVRRRNPWPALSWLLAPFRVITKLWSCWHRHMSRPFTHDGETYRTCLRCGVHRRFNLDEWKTQGRYYRDDEVRQPLNSQSAPVSARSKLRLIA